MNGDGRPNLRPSDVERYRAIPAFGDTLVVYDERAESAWIESDTWIGLSEFR